MYKVEIGAGESRKNPGKAVDYAILYKDGEEIAYVELDPDFAEDNETQLRWALSIEAVCNGHPARSAFVNQ